MQEYLKKKDPTRLLDFKANPENNAPKKVPLL
jgi:hypothetical protein